MRLTMTVVIALFALVASLALVACGDSDDDTTTATTSTDVAKEAKGGGKPAPAIPTIVVRDGKPVGGVEELEYDAGDQIRFEVRSNTADEVHVHGYDVSEEVSAGGSATLAFPADIEGIFEVELHEGEEQIAELRVNP
jgi:major membrane immunogen (membrane-anchored lipoprotein)